MKTLIFFLLITIALPLLFITESKAKGGEIITLDSAHTLLNAKMLLTRLDEINAIDKSHLATSETKALRKELRMIRSELKELKKGTYIPVRTLVVILLLPAIAFSLME
jgi:hypothetical protein